MTVTCSLRWATMSQLQGMACKRDLERGGTACACTARGWAQRRDDIWAQGGGTCSSTLGCLCRHTHVGSRATHPFCAALTTFIEVSFFTITHLPSRIVGARSGIAQAASTAGSLSPLNYFVRVGIQCCTVQHCIDAVGATKLSWCVARTNDFCGIESIDKDSKLKTPTVVYSCRWGLAVTGRVCLGA